MNKVEIEPCTFIDHIRVQAFGPKQADASNQMLPF